MPTTCADWNAVRATWQHCQSFSIAAQAHNLSPDAVRQRARREQWKAEQNTVEQRVASTGAVVTAPLVLSRTVTAPHQAAVTARDKMDARAHQHMRRYVAGAAKELARTARKEPAKAVILAPEAKAVAGTAQGLNMKGFERQANTQETHSHLHLHQSTRP